METNKKTLYLALAYMGIQQLRPWQEAPLEAIRKGRDVMVTLPTGGGKSLLFQAPAFAHVLDGSNSLTLVISPLLALQKDQVAELANDGIPARLLNSDQSGAKRRETLKEAMIQGGLLYLAPEQLQNENVRHILLSADIACVAVDEAHILAQSKDDFRKAYGKIGVFIDELPCRPQVLALTATATPADRRVIAESLNMLTPKTFTFPIRRENLILSVKLVGAKGVHNKRESLHNNRFHAVDQELQAWNGKGSCIIYCPTVKMVKQLFKCLKARDYKIGKFHGKMKRQEREAAYEKFMSGKRPIMVATNAFGLGIDKPDVRLLIHAGLPLSMDGYVQEIGRAGRDGKKSRCVLFYANSDFTDNELILRCGNEEVIHQKLKRLRALRDLVKSSKCIWQGIERYFGQKKAKKCGHCCNCRWKEAR